MDAVAHALADPIRREILAMLHRRSALAGEIAAHFAVSRPAVSRHLSVLREAGLVQATARGRQREYRLVPDALTELRSFIQALQSQAVWERRFDALATEVYRVRKRSESTRTIETERKKDSA